MEEKEKLEKFNNYVLRKFGVVGEVKTSLSIMVCLEFYISEKIYITVLLGYTDMSIWKNIIQQCGTQIVSLEEDDEHHVLQFEKYKDTTERLKMLKYISEIKYLYLHTDYLKNLPLAYTFILSSSSTKTFCKDISKIIAHKILFFPGK